MVTTKLFIDGEFAGNVVRYYKSRPPNDGWSFELDNGTEITIPFERIKYFFSCDYLKIITKEG